LRLLFLNQAFYPDVVSTAQHLADLAAALSARGHEVTVIAARRAYDDPRKRFSKQETWKGVRILRVNCTTFGKHAKWRRSLDFLSFILLCCCRALFLPSQNVVVALTSPPLISVPGLLLARLWRGCFVYWVMDLNPDEAVAAGWLPAGSLSARLLNWGSRLSLREADKVIALDRFMCAQLCQKGVSPRRIRILPPWSHDEQVRFDPIGRRRFRQRHGLEGKFVVMYSGNHSPCHPLDTVTAAAQRLGAQQDIIFCFVGGGSEFRKIQGLLAAMDPDPGAHAANPSRLSIVCLPYQPLDELSASLSAADLHLTVLGDRFVGLVHPCKIYNILRVGAPVLYIGPRPSSVSDALAAADGSVVSVWVRHGDIEGLVKEIERLRSASRQLVRPLPPGESSSPFSQAKLVAAFVRLLEETRENAERLKR